MNDPTQTITNSVRVLMVHLARFLDKTFGGKLRPAHITTFSLVGHIPAAWALWNGQELVAVYYIVFFGLMDSLDGALARVQKSASERGMFYDAVTDRMKETILYSALAVYVSKEVSDVGVWVVPAVIGSSLLVSYVKAKGEMAVSNKRDDLQALNREFSGGLARYEIRMALLVIGLVAGLVGPLLHFILAINLLTVAIRFLEIARVLDGPQSHKARTVKQGDKS